MWTEDKIVKSNRNGNIRRFICQQCGNIKDSKKEPFPCKHNNGYNLDSIWTNIVRSALGVKSGRSRLEITITKKYIEKLFFKQDQKCAISGVSISLGRNASLDRINSSLGYTKENVQWVHKDVNLMKGMFSEEYFKEVCEHVYNYNNNKFNT
jgi:hypothetical protein